MAADADARITDPPEVIEEARRARRGRWLWIVIGVVAPASLLLAAAVAVIAWWWAEHAKAVAAVQTEVARIQAAGEPITTDDMYAYHRVPAGVPDLTREWLAVLASFDEQKFSADSANLPIVGNAPEADLEPGVPGSRSVEARQFLQTYDATLQRAITVGRKPGQCRIPVEFDQGIATLLPNAQKIRTVSRLLALDVRLKAQAGDMEGAVTSAEAMFGVPRAMQRQMTLIEQLVGMATLATAIRETEFLLNHYELTDEQLARLQAQLAEIDVQDGLTHGLLGERALGYHTFHHIDALNAMQGNAPIGRIDADEGRLSRPADCRLFLEVSGEMIAASRLSHAEAKPALDKIDQRIQAIAGSRNPLERFQYMTTAMIMPATSKAFSAASSRVAQQGALLTALAAERYRLKTGSFPTALTQLVPDFLPAVPVDPFDGRPLRMVARPGEISIYSVGKDGRDDGGVDQSGNGEPDVVVTVQEKKGDPDTQ